MPKKLTREEFIVKACAVHGVGKYDYSQTVYLPTPQKVAIKCPTHGVFTQKASQHLLGRGCALCANKIKALAAQSISRKWDTASVRIELANAYPLLDFSKFEYLGNSVASLVACPLHGERWRTPHQMLKGNAHCLECRHEAMRGAPRLSRAQHLARFRAAHGDRYDYSDVSKLILSDRKVAIKCLEHGVFTQVPASHAAGQGCPKCGAERIKNYRSKPRSHYLARFRAAHGDRYDYSDVSEAFLATEKVAIKCLEHGVFTMTADSHAAGHGCPKCATDANRANLRSSWAERAAKGTPTLYFLRLWGNGEEFYKVGITYREISKRYANNSVVAGYQLEILALHHSTNAAAVFDWEQSIIETFAHLRYRPKKKFGGESECFSSADEILAIFPL